MLLVTGITAPFVVTVVVLHGFAYPHEYTFADIRAMPEAQLRYPSAEVVEVSGNGYMQGGIDARSTPAEVDTKFTAPASMSQILDWYRSQLRAMGWQYAGCINTIGPPNGASALGSYVFGRGSDEVFSLSFDARAGTYATRLVLQTTVSATSEVASDRLGRC